MRDPRDVLSDFFFGRVLGGVMMAGTLLLALVLMLSGCGAAPAEEKPVAVPASAPSEWRGYKTTVTFPNDDGRNMRLWVFADPETGCEYLMTESGGPQGRMAQASDGRMMQQGCRAGTFRGRP